MATRWIIASIWVLAVSARLAADDAAPSPPVAAKAAEDPGPAGNGPRSNANRPALSAPPDEKLFGDSQTKAPSSQAVSPGTRLLPAKGMARKEVRPRGTHSPMEGWPSIGNVAGSLGIVVGVFLAVVWGMRRMAPKGAAQLPKEAFEVLGRAPLVGRRQAQLIRCGPKLLLVSVAANEIETLTEITEPAEVDRLAGLCMASHPTSASAAFRGILDHFAKEPAKGFLGRGEPDPFEALRRGDAREVRHG